jgi:hypothetical protein
MSDSELTVALDEIGITSDACHVRFVSTESNGKRTEWPHDVWSVTLHYGDKTHTTEFKCGIGHRKLLAGFPKRDIRSGYKGMEYYVERYGWLDGIKAAEAKLTKPIAPSTADVLAALLSDASGAGETFEEWCSNYGYSDDSMKAMETYRTCQKTRAALQRFLGTELMDRLGGLEH